MSIQTDVQLAASSQQIANEITAGANTATRVGTLFQNLTDSKGLRPVVGIDNNSMVDGDISSYGWQTHTGASPAASVVHLAPFAATTGGYVDATLVNPAGNATATGSLEHSFTLPPGTTSMTLTVPIAAVSGTPTVKLALLDSTRAELSANIVTTNTTEANYTLAPTGLVAGLLYYASIQVNNSSQQASVYVGRITVTPGAGGSGVFGGGFRRQRILGAHMSDTSALTA